MTDTSLSAAAMQRAAAERIQLCADYIEEPFTVGQLADLAKEILALPTPSPADLLAEAVKLPAVRALVDWLTRETRDIETGEPLYDDAHVDITAGEIRRRLAQFTQEVHHDAT